MIYGKGQDFAAVILCFLKVIVGIQSEIAPTNMNWRGQSQAVKSCCSIQYLIVVKSVFDVLECSRLNSLV